MAQTQFLRPKGDTAQIVTYEYPETHPPPSKMLWQHLGCGDIIRNTTALPGQGTWYVNCSSELVQNRQCDFTAIVPTEITMFIENPVSFYANADGIHRVMLSPRVFAHRELLEVAADGRTVDMDSTASWSRPDTYSIENPRGYKKKRLPKNTTERRKANQQRTQEEDSKILRSIGVGGLVRVITSHWENDDVVVSKALTITKLSPKRGNLLKVTLERDQEFIQIIAPTATGPYGGARTWAWSSHDEDDDFSLQIVPADSIVLNPDYGMNKE